MFTLSKKGRETFISKLRTTARRLKRFRLHVLVFHRVLETKQRKPIALLTRQTRELSAYHPTPPAAVSSLSLDPFASRAQTKNYRVYPVTARLYIFHR